MPTAKELMDKISVEMAKAVVGQEEVVRDLIIAVLTGGHVLMEGVPGLAKTLMGRTLAMTLHADFVRIQFTPDLMPSDVIGTTLYDPQRGEFRLKKGPIFTEICLADEINRTPPKTQAALLEAMEERQVSIEGENHSLSKIFTVLATQNPIEYEGTYPLPEAELDRFMMKIVVGYPLPDEERDVLLRFHNRGDMFNISEFGMSKVANEKSIQDAREEIRSIHLEKSIADYIVKLVVATRNHPYVILGASPRGGLSFVAVAKTSAAKSGRSFVVPDDIKEFALPVLRHRLILKPEAEIEGIDPDDVINEIVEQVPVPR